ncbi:hypothetical protein ACFU7Z_27505 [Kitasatospora sp. NPDC057518]|uniref:hypothetical protein n=1 Tax=Kitasatospora sp. NPDC057518 TaxID=3346155 RepID=UPI0036AC2F3D
MSFEHRLGELLKDQDPYATGPDPVPIIAAARRRQARRRAGTAAAAVAVALVCGATAVTAGSARHVGQVAGEAGAAFSPVAVPSPTPTATPSPTATATPLPLSPVRQVGPGQRIEMAAGARMWVSPFEKCDNYQPDGSDSGTDCRDVRSDNLEHDRPALYAQSHGDRDRFIVASFYLGPVAPARIVAFTGGRATVATLVSTVGMQRWIGYYVVLPPLPEADPAAHRRPVSPAIAAYDSEGRLLAELPGTTADGADERAPQQL